MQMEKFIYNCPFPTIGTVELSIMFFANFLFTSNIKGETKYNYFFQSIFCPQMTISISGYAYQNK